MKKVYINPKMKKGLTLEFSLLTSSQKGTLSGDGVNMDINNTGASGDAEGNTNGSFWEDEN